MLFICPRNPSPVGHCIINSSSIDPSSTSLSFLSLSCPPSVCLPFNYKSYNLSFRVNPNLQPPSITLVPSHPAATHSAGGCHSIFLSLPVLSALVLLSPFLWSEVFIVLYAGNKNLFGPDKTRNLKTSHFLSFVAITSVLEEKLNWAKRITLPKMNLLEEMVFSEQVWETNFWETWHKRVHQ